MSEWTPDGGDGTYSEETLERELAWLGPLLRRRDDVGAPDPAFVARTRARLMSGATAVSYPIVEPVVVSSLASRRRRLLGDMRGVVTGVAAAILIAAAVIVVVVVVRPPRPSRGPVLAWRPPLPSLADLTRGFPAPAVARAAGPPVPTASLAAPPHGVAYAGRVSLTTAPLPARVARVQAFRLAAPATIASPARVARLARSLGIHAPVQRIAGESDAAWLVATAGESDAAWLVATEGGRSPRPPLHSVAVSRVTGELVYHDASYMRTAPREPWVDNPSAVAAARTWLTRRGWSGARAPLTAIEHSGIPAGLREIEFSWAGAGAAATDAATLWVTPGGRVVEADVWPPVESVQSIPAGSIVAAWTAVRGRRVPLAVEGVPPHTTAPGVGVMRDVTLTHVLSTGADGRSYLVPAYHFAGTARLHGIRGERVCYALAPAGGEGTRT